MPDRLPRVRWPNSFPICTLAGITLALLLTAATGYLQVRMMQPLRRFYVLPFLKSSLLPIRQNFRLIEVYARGPEHGYIMAVDPWIAISREHHRLQLTVTKEGLAAGISNPRLYLAHSIKPQTIRPFFERSIYHGNLTTVFRATFCVFGLLLAAGILIGAWFDQQHQDAVRRGVQIRGPRMMSPRKAQKYLKGDGIALFLQPKTK